MAYTVKMILIGKRTEEGFSSEPLAGDFPSVDAANRAGDAEIDRLGLPPGAITYKVFNEGGQEVDEAGMGLS